VLVKLADSPFYAVGGGQVSDLGVIECDSGDCRARVADVVRLGDDQALIAVLEHGELHEGERVHARVEPGPRHATECNHTATHLLHAALRQRLGTHVRQAGSYVGPDKLRFDFSHGSALSAQELGDVEDQINAWIVENHPVRAITTTLDEARSLGAMALFGEKYGEVVRMVEVGHGEFSRELCGGTHVRSTAAIGLLRITSETSSAANVRRIEAITGPVAVSVVLAHDRALQAVAGLLRTTADDVLEVVEGREKQRRELEAAARRGDASSGLDPTSLAASAVEVGGVPVVLAIVEVADAKALPDAADRVKGKLGGDGVIVLASAIDGRASVVVSVAPSIVARGVRAGEVVKAAAGVLGGGGGGRDTLAQAGGSEVGKLDEALAAAKLAIGAALER
jgi:alanyl-tRNA synthetase